VARFFAVAGVKAAAMHPPATSPFDAPSTALLSASLPAYAELHCLTSFSFQRGASQPEELVKRASALGYSALAITDECSVAGVVRAHQQARALGLKLLLGAELYASYEQEGGSVGVVVLAHNLAGWGHLCEFITRARRAAVKGSYRLVWEEARWDLLQDCEVLLAIPIRYQKRSCSRNCYAVQGPI
jgi:error-prone DNA polymerase